MSVAVEDAAFSEWQVRWVVEESRAGRLASYTGDRFQQVAFLAGWEAAEKKLRETIAEEVEAEADHIGRSDILTSKAFLAAARLVRGGAQ